MGPHQPVPSHDPVRIIPGDPERENRQPGLEAAKPPTFAPYADEVPPHVAAQVSSVPSAPPPIPPLYSATLTYHRERVEVDHERYGRLAVYAEYSGHGPYRTCLGVSIGVVLSDGTEEALVEMRSVGALGGASLQKVFAGLQDPSEFDLTLRALGDALEKSDVSVTFVGHDTSVAVSAAGEIIERSLAVGVAMARAIDQKRPPTFVRPELPDDPLDFSKFVGPESPHAAIRRLFGDR